MRLLALSLCLVLPAPALAGTLRGRVELIEKGGRRAGDLSDVVIWVEGPKVPPEPKTVRIDMKRKAFVPHVAVVPLGGSVAFPNQDRIFHNAFSVSGENRFDLDLYKRPQSREWKPKVPGIVRVYCNIHPQMSAIVLVRDNPFWARASADGRFTIPDVPAGQWVVKAWHERSGEVAQRVTVGAAGEVDLAFTLDASGYKRAPHKNKFGRDYPAGDRY
jgi:plastocyanin